MALLLNNDDQTRAFVLAEAIAALADGLRQLARGDATRRPRMDLYCPTGRADDLFCLSTMEGVVRAPGYCALRVKPDVMTWPTVNGVRRKETYNTRPGRWGGLVLLFRVGDGKLLAILNDGFIQHARVAVTAALGMRYLARRDARVLGVIGSGGMARSFAQAAALERELAEVRVWSPTLANAEAYAAEMQAALDRPVRVMDDAPSAVREADIVSCCTNALGPVLRGDWLAPGQHVTNVTPWELDAAAYARIEVAGLLSRRTPMQAAGLIDDDFAVRNNALSWAAGQPDERARIPGSVAPGEPYPNARYVDCVDWTTGEGCARDDAAITTLANASFGTRPGDGGQSSGLQGIQFATVGGHLYERAVALGLGRELPDDWFLQDVVT